MTVSNPPIRLLVIQLPNRSIEQGIIDGLQAAGFTTQERVCQSLDVSDDNPINYDCQLVDWRDSDEKTARHFQKLAGRVPVVALIDADLPQENVELVTGFSDFVCEQEIGFASFTLRLRRLIGRYRDPLTLTSTHAPEAQLLQTVVNHSSDWVFIKDLDHRF